MNHEISFVDQFTQDRECAKLLHQEETVLEVTEMICELMESRAINRTQLAALLGKSKGRVSQLLDGEANMTLKTLADILFVLKSRLAVKASKAEDGCAVYQSDVWPQDEFVVNQLDAGWSSAAAIQPAKPHKNPPPSAEVARAPKKRAGKNRGRPGAES